MHAHTHKHIYCTDTGSCCTSIKNVKATDLIHGGEVSPGLAVKFMVRGPLFPGYSPVIRPHLPRGHRLPRDPGWGRGSMGLHYAGPLAAIVDSLKVKRVRPGCLVFKDHLEFDKKGNKIKHQSKERRL